MINRTQFGINEDVPLYNIRIVRTHIDYVNRGKLISFMRY
jgi:hypothetical protein